MNRGIGRKSRSWYRWETRCQRCTALLTQREGICCANFGKPGNGLPECERAWCASCYRQRSGTNYSVYTVSTSGEFDMPAPQEEDDFLVARAGDNLFCPFECDYCTFYRLTQRTPNLSTPRDLELMNDIRQVYLDAFWSRATGTVASLVRSFWDQAEIGRLKGFEMFPQPVGPFPRQYDSGIRAAIAVLAKSTRPGRHEKFVKFSTAQKERTVHTNLGMISATGGAMGPQMNTDKHSYTLCLSLIHI